MNDGPLEPPVPSRSPKQRAIVAAGFAAALAIRIAFLLAYSPNYDLQSFEIVAGIVERGGDVYAETGRYNYSPLWAYTVAGLDLIGRSLGVPLARVVTSLLLLVDAATALLVFRILRARGRRFEIAALCALLFFGNPVSVMASSHRGMFDNVAVLFLLLGILWLERVPPPSGLLGASAALAVSLLVKHIAWFHPLLFLPRRRREAVRGLVAVVLPYAVFAASFLFFWRSWRHIRANVFQYGSIGEPYGFAPLRLLEFMPRWGATAMLVVPVFAAVLWLRFRDVEFGRASLLLLLVVLICLPGVTPYYFVWPIALGALYPSAGFAVYTVMIALFYIHSPDVLGIELPHLPGWGGVWFASLFWLLWEIRTLSRPPVRGGNAEAAARVRA